MLENNQVIETQENSSALIKQRFFTKSLPILLLISLIMNLSFVGSLFFNRANNSNLNTTNKQLSELEESNAGQVATVISPEEIADNPIVSQAVTPITTDPDKDKAELTSYLKKYFYDNLLDSKYRVSHNITQENVVVEIDKYVSDFASGTWNLPSGQPGEGGGGSVWWAAKVNSSWLLVETAQEPPSCKLMTQFKFPKEISGGCVEK